MATLNHMDTIRFFAKGERYVVHCVALLGLSTSILGFVFILRAQFLKWYVALLGKFRKTGNKKWSLSLLQHSWLEILKMLSLDVSNHGMLTILGSLSSLSAYSSFIYRERRSDPVSRGCLPYDPWSIFRSHLCRIPLDPTISPQLLSRFSHQGMF